MTAPNYAFVINVAEPHLSRDDKYVSSTLLDLNTGLTAILNATTVATLSTSVFVVHEGDLSNVTTMPIFAGTQSSQYLAYEENDYWNINDNTPQWTPRATTTGVTRDWLKELLAAFDQDLTTVTTKIKELNLPGLRDGAPPDRQPPGTQTPFPPPSDTDQRARLPSRAADELFQANAQNVSVAARLSEHARPMSSFLNAGPKASSASRSVQVSYGEDNNSFTFSTPQQTRPPETMTASMFHSASLKMQSTIYSFLDLQLFHNNILANYIDKYTMSSILAYEHAVRQLVHDLPPATTFQTVYLELASLHLVSKEEALYRQQLLSLQSSSSFQQRASGAHAQQPTAPAYRTQAASAQYRAAASSSPFPPCQNFATKECENIINGRICTRDHACAACGKAYPSQRCCPAGHKGEEVCPGINQQITQRLSLLGKKRILPDAHGGGGKRRNSAN